MFHKKISIKNFSDIATVSDIQLMKKTFILTLAFFQATILLGQTIITNKITPNHREVRGSKISLIPPADFASANKFMGYQQEETNASIMILDIPSSFLESTKGLNKESLLTQGVKVESIDEIKLNNIDGILIKGEQTAYEVIYRKYIFAFGNEKETIMINGVSPKEDFDLDLQIKNSILSAVYDADKILSPLDAVDFEISTNETDFVFAKSMSNMLVYNRDGKMPTENVDKASLVIAKAFSKIAISDKKEFATNRIKTLPVQIHKINFTNAVEINGLSGFEITAEGVNRKTGIKEIAYQMMLFTEDGYYIIFGSSESDFDKNIAVFKKIALTFKLK